MQIKNEAQLTSNSNSNFKSKNRRKVRNDIVFIAALLLVVTLGALSMLLFRTEGGSVTVSVDGKLYGEYSLDVDGEYEIKSEGGYNLLIIEEGRAYVKSASCPDGICSSHRPIEYGGQSIICLPNKVIIEVKARDGGNPDIIS